jgi:hypothetical protein
MCDRVDGLMADFPELLLLLLLQQPDAQYSCRSCLTHVHQSSTRLVDPAPCKLSAGRYLAIDLLCEQREKPTIHSAQQVVVIVFVIFVVVVAAASSEHGAQL